MAAERSADAAAAAEARLASVTLGDLEAVRLLLRGGSVIDWHRLDLRDHDEVDRFLRVNELDPTRAGDVERLETLRAEAVDYLVRNYGFRLPDDIAERIPARDLLLVASRRSKKQVYACLVLKVMHIIHHLAGRELGFRLPVSDDELFRLVEKKVVRIVEEIRGAGHPIIEFQWSRKTHDSLVTKLLAKKSNLAANVYDKLRFRLVTREREDLLPCLLQLIHRMIPFNYVVPGESQNDIITFRRVVEESPSLSKLAPLLQQDIGFEEDEGGRANEFSGPGYAMINFVADLPVRIDEHVMRVDDPAFHEYGPIVFVMTEFQIVDVKTAQSNDQGENSHERYKERQMAKVKVRLLRGMSSGDEPEKGG
ncbi:MAG TPA: TIGR04552 family protein [Haliangiales bacterium]|nr:TIGR04552 family protein [Haliangiales bacterium]